MNPADLERLIDEELKRLPAPRAPRTLLPGVLAATVHRRPPSQARPWLSWPLAWQTGSVVAVGVVVTGIYMLAQQALSWWTGGGSGLPGELTDLLSALSQASALVRVSWRLLLEPVAFSVIVAAVTLSLGCAALWSVLDRVALGGASES
ncbi:MAG: hypothetical protein EHM24_23050 [Acidobacteria bacterium]|nr:MAG: hypothetical protein EHM24_23050 [Acidobacteriota bacterium]